MNACAHASGSLMVSLPDPGSVAYLGRERGEKRESLMTASQYLNDRERSSFSVGRKINPLTCHRALMGRHLSPRGSLTALARSHLVLRDDSIQTASALSSFRANGLDITGARFNNVQIFLKFLVSKLLKSSVNRVNLQPRT